MYLLSALTINVPILFKYHYSMILHQETMKAATLLLK